MAKDSDNKSGGGGDAAVQGPPPRLRQHFREQVAPSLKEKFGRSNPMSWPRLEKIVINVNMGRHLDGAKLPANVRDTALETLTKISGQKPIMISAKKSVANFKVREGMPTSAMVTLRRERMWHFMDRLVNLATPRIKDFRGLPAKSFDGAGNYSMGLTEQGVFPEIDMGSVSFVHGMHINFVFRNSTPEMSRYILEELGMPFEKQEESRRRSG
jgi:large subunit ribosomal protein L5